MGSAFLGGLIVAVVFLGFLTGAFAVRLYKLEQKYNTLTSDYKELSNHILVTNRDVTRPSSQGGRWKRVQLEEDVPQEWGAFAPAAKEAETDN